MAVSNRALAVLLFLSHLTKAFVNYGDVLPINYTLGENVSIDDITSYSGEAITLSPGSPYLTLDYGTEVAGFPFFNVASLTGPTQIEVRYAEQYPALENVNSDGPWTFSNGLSSSFRVETFNLTSTGRTESFFVQGGQRWQTVRLLTNTTVEFAAVGINSTSAHVPVDETPGQLSTSNAVYNGIWDLGARVAQVACVDAGNAPSTFEITPDGALIRGQTTAQSVKGLGMANYTLSFSTKIVRGGTGWRVASGTSPFGAVFILTSNYPADRTFINTNTTLLPPNILVFDYGWGIVNQTTLQTGWDQYFPVNISVEENTWYNISTTITRTGYSVSIDSTAVAFVPILEAALLAPSGSFSGTGSPYAGTWGFGPWQDEIAFVKDVSVTASNGTLIYYNSMTLDDTLAEYSVAPLNASICLDGAKRDRLVWIGDFYQTTRVIGSSTLRWDYVLGTIDYVFSWQKKTPPFAGFVPISPSLGARPEHMDSFVNSYAALIDYQDLLLSAIGNYFRLTGDTEGLRPYWNQTKALVNARLTYIDPVSGLMAGEGAFYFLGPVNGSAVTALSACALRKLVSLAEALGDNDAAVLYSATAAELSEAINAQLWNPELGVYSLSLDAPANYSLTAIAWTILSGTANATQAASMIAKLPELQCGVGLKTGSGDQCADDLELSPNTQGFLLEALFQSHRDFGTDLTIAKSLLGDFWSKMVTQNEYFSGASWEYLYPDGSPGIGLFTSLAHPWGAAPTYVMPEYVLGISATSPGYKTWTFEPLVEGLGLMEANGTVVTPYGDIEASWKIVGDGVEVTATVPKGTNGTLILPHKATAKYGGEHHSGGRLSLNEGERAHMKVHGWLS